MNTLRRFLMGLGLARALTTALTVVLATMLTAVATAQINSIPDEALCLRMRDGSFHFGSLVAHDPEGILFARIENGGQVRIPWALLDPVQENELRTKLGYVDLTGDELMIDADRLETVEGKEIIGVIIERSADTILVKTAGAIVPVPKSRLTGTSTIVHVPAREVYTKEELYARELAARAPANAEAHVGMAQFCEQNLDFVHAAEHYKKALELDATFKPDELKAALARTAEKAKALDQLEYLADVDLLLARKSYDLALAKADAFKDKYENSTLIPEAKKKHDRIIKARDAALSERVMYRWYDWAGRFARDAAMKMTLEQALSYVEDKMKKDIQDAVTRDAQTISKQIDSDGTRKLWSSRKKGKWYRASYGNGTWLLGKEQALKGEEPDKPGDKKEPTGELDKARAEVNAKVQRFLANQVLLAKAKTSAEQKDDREAFWKEFSSSARAGWILAYYAEHAGEFEVSPKPLFDNCRECGGTGVIEMVVSGANAGKTNVGKATPDQKHDCPTCHGLGRVRRISYR